MSVPPQFSVNETTLVFAFRYALTRRTGAVTHVIEELRRHWLRLTPYTRKQIRREIELAGKDCEMNTWGQVMEWTENTCPHCVMPLHNCLCSHDD